MFNLQCYRAQQSEWVGKVDATILFTRENFLKWEPNFQQICCSFECLTTVFTSLVSFESIISISNHQFESAIRIFYFWLESYRLFKAFVFISNTWQRDEIHFHVRVRSVFHVHSMKVIWLASHEWFGWCNALLFKSSLSKRLCAPV